MTRPLSPDAADTELDDHDAAHSDPVFVRTLSREDFAEVVRINRKIIGRDRTEYFERKFDEALHESAVQVSLVAEIDSRPVGFIMARVDPGDFGQTEPVAVIDTLGVDPLRAGNGVGKALLRQLLMNLGALRVDRVETQVATDNFDLLGFFLRNGGGPSQRLAFCKRLDDRGLDGASSHL